MTNSITMHIMRAFGVSAVIFLVSGTLATVPDRENGEAPSIIYERENEGTGKPLQFVPFQAHLHTFLTSTTAVHCIALSQRRQRMVECVAGCYMSERVPATVRRTIVSLVSASSAQLNTDNTRSAMLLHQRRVTVP